jgi:hypothetical protein
LFFLPPKFTGENVNANHAQPDEAAPPENIVSLTEGAQELTKKRAIVQRAFEISRTQLERDALKMEESAIVGEHTLERRHELMDLARALRMSGAWLQQLVQPEPKPEP